MVLPRRQVHEQSWPGQFVPGAIEHGTRQEILPAALDRSASQIAVLTS